MKLIDFQWNNRNPENGRVSIGVKDGRAVIYTKATFEPIIVAEGQSVEIDFGVPPQASDVPCRLTIERG